MGIPLASKMPPAIGTAEPLSLLPVRPVSGARATPKSCWA